MYVYIYNNILFARAASGLSPSIVFIITLLRPWIYFVFIYFFFFRRENCGSARVIVRIHIRIFITVVVCSTSNEQLAAAITIIIKIIIITYNNIFVSKFVPIVFAMTFTAITALPNVYTRCRCLNRTKLLVIFVLLYFSWSKI